MTVFVGAALAAGVLLCLSPWMWPRREGAAPTAKQGRLVRLIEEAGLDFSQRTLMTVIVAAGLVAASTVWLLTGLAVLALLAGLAGAAAPVMFLRGRRLRLRRLRRQLWPDVCDLLIASIRVGLSLPDAVASLAESAPKMLRPAFVVFARDLRASGRFETSLDRLKSTLADPIGDRIAETLRMARQVGGTELIGVLRALSSSVRADAALRGEVEARQSWIRGAAVLGAVAPWVILGLLVLRPEGAAAYGTPEGVLVICAGAAVSILAFHIMVRIGRLPEPRRWFG
ncbi:MULTISPECIES: type II secretion system F family protein [unclassified Microbacterium]|uniref:type II secretion system F family protein n=1 Tax=unclassified Microbacterium TaxID=2609290 RepID=UPI000CFC0E8E|nr:MULTISPECIES: type II secretion system F family protein [unclassified Microbacterium]PQZ52742.1 type II secretion protein F [Microbacterium sp. MYb43]PQZ74322.1 type II secretion protein F [Microbacterium sp. MYb40]PRB18174.1 type II secretion protein F [Microbacterium sp. MYb54]PRB23517.1 type II secretion protein F [Microbacterium sp. MYb50]PRB62086.1 type II secretion protein F [Microbacterium sp. MYb24]